MNLMLWPGKRLDLAEEAWLRNRISSLQRAEDARARRVGERTQGAALP
jgi:hypothetical protein